MLKLLHILGNENLKLCNRIVLRMFKQNNKGRKCCDPVHQSQWEWAVRSKFRSEYELDEKIVKIITY